MFLATDSFVAFDLLLFTNLDVALVAGSAASVIHIIDAQIDINMARTSRRPIAQGRVSVKSGILFSAVTGIAGMSIIALLVDGDGGTMRGPDHAGSVCESVGFCGMQIRHDSSQE